MLPLLLLAMLDTLLLPPLLPSTKIHWAEQSEDWLCVQRQLPDMRRFFWKSFLLSRWVSHYQEKFYLWFIRFTNHLCTHTFIIPEVVTLYCCGRDIVTRYKYFSIAYTYYILLQCSYKCQLYYTLVYKPNIMIIFTSFTKSLLIMHHDSLYSFLGTNNNRSRMVW